MSKIIAAAIPCRGLGDSSVDWSATVWIFLQRQNRHGDKARNGQKTWKGYGIKPTIALKRHRDFCEKGYAEALLAALVVTAAEPTAATPSTGWPQATAEGRFLTLSR